MGKCLSKCCRRNKDYKENTCGKRDRDDRKKEIELKEMKNGDGKVDNGNRSGAAGFSLPPEPNENPSTRNANGAAQIHDVKVEQRPVKTEKIEKGTPLYSSPVQVSSSSCLKSPMQPVSILSQVDAHTGSGEKVPREDNEETEVKVRRNSQFNQHKALYPKLSDIATDQRAHNDRADDMSHTQPSNEGVSLDDEPRHPQNETDEGIEIYKHAVGYDEPTSHNSSDIRQYTERLFGAEENDQESAKHNVQPSQRRTTGAPSDLSLVATTAEHHINRQSPLPNSMIGSSDVKNSCPAFAQDVRDMANDLNVTHNVPQGPQPTENQGEAGRRLEGEHRPRRAQQRDGQTAQRQLQENVKECKHLLSKLSYMARIELSDELDNVTDGKNIADLIQERLTVEEFKDLWSRCHGGADPPMNFLFHLASVRQYTLEDLRRLANEGNKKGIFNALIDLIDKHKDRQKDRLKTRLDKLEYHLLMDIVKLIRANPIPTTEQSCPLWKILAGCAELDISCINNLNAPAGRMSNSLTQVFITYMSQRYPDEKVAWLARGLDSIDRKDLLSNEVLFKDCIPAHCKLSTEPT